ncbi:hypothetical protein ABT215_06170 [Streptomyces sp900105755]|uniref:hypothetical protein n=1 Tax=Streptomyces sp. 900105755 TaxID=3154389 RepID=UPI00332148C4
MNVPTVDTTTRAAALLPSAARRPPAQERQGVSLLAAPTGRRGILSRPAVPGRRGFFGPASHLAPHGIPVPTPAHPTLRAIRVHRSPR